MKLYIDTSDAGTIMVGIGDLKITKKSRKNKSQKLLVTIDELLKKAGKSMNDVSEIEINRGPGSFTGLRIGMAVANVLGWALKIPVNGQDVSQNPVTPRYKQIPLTVDKLG